MTSKKIISIILSLSITLGILMGAVPISADNTISTENYPLAYTRYFAVERAVLQAHPANVNRSYVVPFIGGINAEAAETIAQDNSSYDTTDRNIYMMCIEDGITYAELLFEGNYSSISYDGDILYAIEDNYKIYKLIMSTGIKELLYTSDVPLLEIYGFNDVVFFDSETDIFRLHILSGIVDSFAKPSAVVGWKPLTNQTIHYTENNTFFATCIQKEQEFYSKEAFFEWFQLAYASIYDETIATELYSSFQALAIDSFLLDILNIGSLNRYYYNFETDLITTTYTMPDAVINTIEVQNQAESTLIAELRSDSSETYATATPGVSYSTGDHFSTNSSGCTCHGYSASCDFYGGCDCLSFESAIQCNGYARYVYHAINGVYTRSTSNSSTFAYSLSTVNTSIDTIAYFMGLPKCAFVDFGSHIIAITGADIYGVTYSHANVGNKSVQNNRCRIENNVYRTYSNFSTYNSGLFSTVNRAIIPSSVSTTHSHYYAPLISGYNAYAHYWNCVLCNTSSYEAHTVNSAGTKCTVCGYTGPFGNIVG